MLKKILIAVLILGVIVVAFIGYSTYKLANEALKEQEPMLRQYMQMSMSEQNEYIITHAKEIIAQSLEKATPEDKAALELAEKTKDDPTVQRALVNFGRSFMAALIMHSDAIVKDMIDDVKSDYQIEADALKANADAYDQALEDAKKRLNLK